jgi:hypothetical protein
MNMSKDLSVTFCKLLRSLKSVKCIFFSNLDPNSEPTFYIQRKLRVDIILKSIILKAAPCFWLETILLQVTIADTLEKAHLDENRSYIVGI